MNTNNMFVWRNEDNYPRFITKYSSLTFPLIQYLPGLPLSGRTTYVTPWDCHRTSKLSFKDVPRTSEISFVRPKSIPKTSINCQKTRPLLYDVCPAYLPEIRYLSWLSFKDVPLSAWGSFIDSRVKRRGTLLMAAWSQRVFVTRAELINWCFYN